MAYTEPMSPVAVMVPEISSPAEMEKIDPQAVIAAVTEPLAESDWISLPALSVPARVP